MVNAEKEISYPKDQKLRQALQGLIKLVLTEGAVRFQAKTCIEAIMEHMELLDDKSTNPKQGSGSNYKKAKNYLKTLNKYARLVPGAFAVIEIFVFTTDGKRIQTLDELKQICSEDEEMNKITVFSEFDYNQPWLDTKKQQERRSDSMSVLAEISRIDDLANARREMIASTPLARRHNGIFKGSEDPGAAKNAITLKKRSRSRIKAVKQKEPKEEEVQEVLRPDDTHSRNALSEFA